MNRLETTIHAPVPFSLKATALSHGWHECSPMSWSEGGRCFQIIDRHGGGAMRVSVTQAGCGNRKVPLRVTVEGQDVDEAALELAATRVRYVLSLDRDLSEFYAICEEHPTLYVVPELGAGRCIRSASMTENIIKALCATNVNWTQAVKMINRVGQLGPPLRHFVSLTAWPTPREILRAGESYLRDVCRLGYRVELILAFCKDVCDGRFDPESLIEQARDPSTTTDDLLTQLRSIRGIGPSSAHYLLGFLDRSDHLSIDSATIAHVAYMHNGGRRPTIKKVESIYAKYGRWKNLVWWFESWLNWDTAKQIMREEGIEAPAKHGRGKRSKRKKRKPQEDGG